MRETNCRIAAVVLLISAANAFAAPVVDFTTSLSVAGNGGVYDIPESGGTFDVRVNFLRPSDSSGEIGSIGSAQTDFVADASGITIGGVSGSGTAAQNIADLPTSTGTRYNQLEYYVDPDSALNPNTTLAGVMAAGVPRGTMGALYIGSWTSGDSFFGYLHVTLAPRPYGTLINLNPTNGVLGRDIIFTDIDPVDDGMTFHYVPEPASALLLLGALPFLRRRRTA